MRVHTHNYKCLGSDFQQQLSEMAYMWTRHLSVCVISIHNCHICETMLKHGRIQTVQNVKITAMLRVTFSSWGQQEHALYMWKDQGGEDWFFCYFVGTGLQWQSSGVACRQKSTWIIICLILGSHIPKTRSNMIMCLIVASSVHIRKSF